VQVQMVESVLGDVSDTKSRVLLDLSLLGQCLALEVKGNVTAGQHGVHDDRNDHHHSRSTI